MIALVFALRYESTTCQAIQTPQVRIWRLGVAGLSCVAALKQQLLEKGKPAILISAGLGAGLQEQLSHGSLVIGANYTSPCLLQNLQISQKIWIGDIHTAKTLIATTSEKKRLGNQTGALVGDLETAHIYELCSQFDIPMLALRAVSDTIDQTLPVKPSFLIKPETGQPDPLGLFGYILKHPSRIFGFWRLIRGATIAKSSLAQGLKLILPQLLNSN